MNLKKLSAFALVAFLVMTGQTACQTNKLISDPFGEEATESSGSVETSVTVTEPEEPEAAEATEETTDTEEVTTESPAAPESTPPAADDELSSAMPEGKEQATDEINVAEVSVVKEFSLRAKEWEFIPAEIRVSQGDEVVLTITSEDVEHGFFLPEFKISETLTPGTPVTVKFTADKTGTFTFRCNVFCGTGHGGMTGTLVVE